MNKKEFKILILLLWVYILSPLHKLFDNIYYDVDLFLFKDVCQDTQWYIKNNIDMIINVILYYIIYQLASIKLKKITFVLYLFSYIFFPLYWLFYLRFDFIIYSLLFIILSIIMYYEKRNNIR